MTKPRRKALVETAYRMDLSETDCINELARTGDGAFARSTSTIAISSRIDGARRATLSAVTSEDEALDRFVRSACRALPIELQLRMAQGAPALATASELLAGAVMERLAAETDATEIAGVFCPNGYGMVVIAARQPAPRRFSAPQHREWSPVAAHVGAAWRLRNALSTEQLSGLVFTADGAFVEEGAAQDTASRCLLHLLRRAVTRRERLRAGNGDSLWPAVVAGEWILVDRFEASGRRHVVAYPCDALARPFQTLTRAQSFALRRALDGTASKVIASEMCVSDSTASRLIQRALRALGLRDLADASLLRSMPHSTVRVGSGPHCVHVGVLTGALPDMERVPPNFVVGLTQAERDVLAAIIRGCSHQQVAAQRGTAKRTVANQVASIFCKLGVRSRRELVARLVAGTLTGKPGVER
jgi:DNA-binding NarL/FixJ family response regulator